MLIDPLVYVLIGDLGYHNAKSVSVGGDRTTGILPVAKMASCNYHPAFSCQSLDQDIFVDQFDNVADIFVREHWNTEMFKNVHAEILISTSGDILSFSNRFIRKGTLKMIEGDTFAHGNAIVNEITNKTAQAQHRLPRQPANEKTDAH